jgi:hypothetical protein
MRQRDEAQEKCQRFLLEKLLLQQQQQETGPLSGIFSIEDEPRRGIDSNNGLLGERERERERLVR